MMSERLFFYTLQLKELINYADIFTVLMFLNIIILITLYSNCMLYFEGATYYGETGLTQQLWFWSYMNKLPL